MMYFAFKVTDTKSPRYLQVLSVHRFDRHPFLTEKWDAQRKVWIDCPDLISSTGWGDGYYPISQEEAFNFIAKPISEGGG